MLVHGLFLVAYESECCRVAHAAVLIEESDSAVLSDVVRRQSYASQPVVHRNANIWVVDSAAGARLVGTSPAFVVAHREFNVASAGPRARLIIEPVWRVVKLNCLCVGAVVADCLMVAPVELISVEYAAVFSWFRVGGFSKHGPVNRV